MATLYMTIGIPGSGKSTAAKQLNVSVVSTDDIREELLGDASDQSNQGLIFEEARFRVDRYLKNDEDCVIDCMNLMPRTRKMWLNLARKYNAKIVALVLPNDVELCIKRQKLRERKVPAEYIMKCGTRRTMPTAAENFDEVRYYE